MPRKQKPKALDPDADVLTAKQRAFVEEFCIDLNASQAALRAGYSPDTAARMGSENLQKPVIREQIRAHQKQRAERLMISEEFVLSSLLKNYNRAMQAEPVMGKDGPTGEYKYDGAVAKSTMELIGKHIAMWPNKSEVTSNSKHDIKLLHERPIALVLSETRQLLQLAEYLPPDEDDSESET